MTFSITMLSIMTFSILDLNVTLSIMTLGINIIIIMLNFIILSVAFSYC
jgi:hypothetical protein